MGKEACSVCIAIVVAVAAIGCTSRMMINPEYKSKDLAGKSLHVAMVGEAKIDYEGSKEHEFGGEGKYGKIRTFICSTAVKAIKSASTFDSVDIIPVACNFSISKKLDMGSADNPIAVRLPEDTCFPSADSQSVFLFIEQTSVVSHPYIQIITMGFIPVAGIPHKPLTIGGNFVYWDAARKKPIAWGCSSGTYDQGAGVTMTHWNNAAYDFSNNMIKKSPFDTTGRTAKTKHSQQKEE